MSILVHSSLLGHPEDGGEDVEQGEEFAELVQLHAFREERPGKEVWREGEQ